MYNWPLKIRILKKIETAFYLDFFSYILYSLKYIFQKIKTKLHRGWKSAPS